MGYIDIRNALLNLVDDLVANPGDATINAIVDRIIRAAMLSDIPIDDKYVIMLSRGV